MVRLLKGSATTFVVTLNELTTISNPEYLFEFIEEQSDRKYYCILTDTSSYPTRFNEFTLTDGSDVTFVYDGFYTYRVYEQANGSGNLDPDGLTMVEEGRAHVYESDAADNEYDNTSETNTVYEEQ